MTAKKAVAKKNAQEVVPVPDYIKQGGNRGNESVTNEDLQLPRINVAQGLSPQVNKNKPEYLEGCEIGMLFNTLTGELYPDGVVFLPITFQKRWFVWKGQDFGGGLQGIFNFDQQSDAQGLTDKLNKPFKEGDEEYECVLTHEHLVMLKDGTEIILSMAKSKLKVSKKFNSLVRLKGGDRFGHHYFLSTRGDQNNEGKDYSNFTVEPQFGADAFPTQERYEAAEALWATISQGMGYGGDYSDEVELDEDGEPVAQQAAY